MSDDGDDDGFVFDRAKAAAPVTRQDLFVIGSHLYRLILSKHTELLAFVGSPDVSRVEQARERAKKTSEECVVALDDLVGHYKKTAGQ